MGLKFLLFGILIIGLAISPNENAVEDNDEQLNQDRPKEHRLCQSKACEVDEEFANSISLIAKDLEVPLRISDEHRINIMQQLTEKIGKFEAQHGQRRMLI